MGACEFCLNHSDTGDNAVPVAPGHDCEVCGKSWAEIRGERDDSASLGEFLKVAVPGGDDDV